MQIKHWIIGHFADVFRMNECSLLFLIIPCFIYKVSLFSCYIPTRNGTPSLVCIAYKQRYDSPRRCEPKRIPGVDSRRAACVRARPAHLRPSSPPPRPNTATTETPVVPGIHGGREARRQADRQGGRETGKEGVREGGSTGGRQYVREAVWEEEYGREGRLPRPAGRPCSPVPDARHCARSAGCGMTTNWKTRLIL